MGRDRRTFLAGVAASGLSCAGCLGFTAAHPEIEAGVEWKSIRGTRENRSRKIVTSRPRDGPVTTNAPVTVDIENYPYDDEFVSFPARGPLVLSDATVRELEAVYEDVQYVLVLTVYRNDDRNGIPETSAYGYRADRTAFDGVQAGDRVAFTPETRADIPWIEDIAAVMSARK